MAQNSRPSSKLYWIVYALGIAVMGFLFLSLQAHSALAQDVPRYSKSELELVFFQEVKRAGQMAHWKSLHAQISQESAWRNWVKSRYAQGLTQFTSPTRGDWYPRTKPSCKGVHWSDPACGIRAQIRYMKWLVSRYRSSQNPWPFAQAGYNGGAGYIDKQVRKCRMMPACKHSEWYGNVEKLCHSFRADWACKENNEYPKRIQIKEDRLR